MKATKLIAILKNSNMVIEHIKSALSLLNQYEAKDLIIRDSLSPSDAINMLNINRKEYSFWLLIERSISLQSLEASEIERENWNDNMIRQSKIIVPNACCPVVICYN